MAATIIDGKALAAKIQERVQAEVAQLRERRITPHLKAVLVGGSPAAEVYAQNQAATCQRLGIRYTLARHEATISQNALMAAIAELNAAPEVTGIMVHMPLPPHLNTQQIQYAIDVRKDVEGVNPANIGHVVYGHTIIAPCTALAVVEVIASTSVPLAGAEAVVVGASRIVGKPVALLLTQCEATVTLCHIRTRDLAEHTRRAEVLVVAAGQPGLIGREHIRPGAVVVDVGINRVPVEEGGVKKHKTVGDVQEAAAREMAGFLSPVPGGVGPVTVAILMKNTVRAARLVCGMESL